MTTTIRGQVAAAIVEKWGPDAVEKQRASRVLAEQRRVPR